MHHGDQVRVGAGKKKFANVKWEGLVFVVWRACDDGGENLVVFRDRAVDRAAESCIKNGLFASREVLLDRGVRDVADERFLEPL